VSQSIAFSLSASSLSAQFDGPRLTSDGGLCWLAEAEAALGLCAASAAQIPEWRRGPVRHAMEMLVRQRFFQIACGYGRPGRCGQPAERSVAQSGVWAFTRAGGPGQPADTVPLGECRGCGEVTRRNLRVLSKPTVPGWPRLRPPRVVAFDSWSAPAPRAIVSRPIVAPVVLPACGCRPA
jgi:hypothetical protein